MSSSVMTPTKKEKLVDRKNRNRKRSKKWTKPVIERIRMEERSVVDRIHDILLRITADPYHKTVEIRWFVRLRNNELYRITYILRILNLLKFGVKIRQINHANSSGKFRVQKIRQIGFSQFVAVCSRDKRCSTHVERTSLLLLHTTVERYKWHCDVSVFGIRV